MTMNRIGVDSEHLVSAATKLARHNERLGSVNEAGYVPLNQRVRFIRAVARLDGTATLGTAPVQSAIVSAGAEERMSRPIGSILRSDVEDTSRLSSLGAGSVSALGRIDFSLHSTVHWSG